MLKKLKHNLSTIQDHQLLLALLWASPLVYVQGNVQLSRTVRWVLLVVVALSSLLLFGYPWFKKGLRRMTVVSQVCFALLFVFMIIGVCISKLNWQTRIVGWDTELLGISSWISFIILALLFRDHVLEFFKSRLCLAIGGLVLVGSLVADISFLRAGDRLPGLFFQATTLGMYAATMLVISIWHVLHAPRRSLLQKMAVALAGISGAVLLLCQSRAGQFAAILICIVYAVYVGGKKRNRMAFPLLVIGLLIVIPLASKSYFQRLQSEEIQTGVHYRLDIYRLSGKEVLKDHPITGFGPSGIPQNINSRDHAPAGIAETLDLGYIFLSAHDIFLDISLYFGLIAGLAFLVLILQAFYRLLVEKLTPELLLLGSIFTVQVINGLFNTPSIELTAFLFVALGALLPVRATK